jgi:N-acetylglucosaminylphosphatidylinositol deacetylase
MKIIGKIKTFVRNVKYRHDKKDEEDSINLVDSSNDNNDQNLKIISRLIRRIPFLSIIRYIIFIPLFIYFLIILTPIKNIQSFIPMEIENIKNFVIVVAHPDDECLFFSPTILGLISRGKTGHILVLSTGNSLGLGTIRQKELKESCRKLDIHSNRCLALNLTDLQDNAHLWWPKGNISQIIEKYIKQFQIDLLITFDLGGISGNINNK